MRLADQIPSNHPAGYLLIKLTVNKFQSKDGAHAILLEGLGEERGKSCNS